MQTSRAPIYTIACFKINSINYSIYHDTNIPLSCHSVQGTFRSIRRYAFGLPFFYADGCDGRQSAVNVSMNEIECSVKTAGFP